MEEAQRAAVHPMQRRKKRRMRVEGLLQERWKERNRRKRRGEGGWRWGRREEGREIVTPRRRVQRQGNERLPALHHAQGLPQSAGGRGKMPHVSGLLALRLVCMHLGLCVGKGVWFIWEYVCVCVCEFKDIQSESTQNVTLSPQKLFFFLRENDVKAVFCLGA